MKISRVRGRTVMVQAEVPPQCSRPIAMPVGASPRYAEWRRGKSEPRGWDTARCQRHAAFIIDNTPLCALHAGQAALSILMSDPTPPEPPIEVEVHVTRKRAGN